MWKSTQGVFGEGSPPPGLVQSAPLSSDTAAARTSACSAVDVDLAAAVAATDACCAARVCSTSRPVTTPGDVVAVAFGETVPGTWFVAEITTGEPSGVATALPSPPQATAS